MNLLLNSSSSIMQQINNLINKMFLSLNIHQSIQAIQCCILLILLSPAAGPDWKDLEMDQFERTYFICSPINHPVTLIVTGHNIITCFNDQCYTQNCHLHQTVRILKISDYKNFEIRSLLLKLLPLRPDRADANVQEAL